MIDGEIRRALDVDPSPEFLARVRTRIAAEPSPSRWPWSWGVAAACAVAASFALAAIVSKPHEAKPVAAVAQPPHAIAENGPPAAVAVPRYDASPRPARAVTPRTKSIAPQVPAPEPEILIDPREMRTLQALIEGVRIGRIDLTAAQNSVSQVPAAPEPVTDIVIAPLTIEPIALVQGAEGVRP